MKKKRHVLKILLCGNDNWRGFAGNKISLFLAVMYKINWNILDLHTLRLELVPLFVCIFVEIRVLSEFYRFHEEVNRHCFLFGTLNEIKRTLSPSSSLICNGQLLFTATSCAILVFVIIKTLGKCPVYLFEIRMFRILAVAMLLWFLLDVMVLWEGLRTLCHSLLSTKECSHESMLGIDFRAFHPKYMRGWKVHSVVTRSRNFQIGATISWIVFIITHRYRHLCRRSKENEINANYKSSNGVKFNQHSQCKNGALPILDV